MELDDDDYAALGYSHDIKLPTRQTLQSKKDIPHIKGAALKVLINTLTNKYSYKQITLTKDELKLIVTYLKAMLELKRVHKQRASKNTTD